MTHFQQLLHTEPPSGGTAENHGHSPTHSHTHGHSHGHEHKNKKAVLNRLAKAAGHLESVRRMIENDRDCSEVLIQLSAVIAALNNTGKIVLQDHIEDCVVEAIRTDNHQLIDDLNKAIDQFIR